MGCYQLISLAAPFKTYTVLIALTLASVVIPLVSCSFLGVLCVQYCLVIVRPWRWADLPFRESWFMISRHLAEVAEENQEKVWIADSLSGKRESTYEIPSNITFITRNYSLTNRVQNLNPLGEWSERHSLCSQTSYAFIGSGLYAFVPIIR